MRKNTVVKNICECLGGITLNRLIDRLGIGEENAKTAGEIGMDPRRIRLEVNRLRKQGHQICSGDRGYWIAKDSQEVERTTNILKSRAFDLLKTARGMEGGPHVDQSSMF